MVDAQIIALIIAITELSKQYIPSKFAPLVSIGIGCVLGLYSNLSIEGVMHGAILGLGTTGLYKAADKFINNK